MKIFGNLQNRIMESCKPITPEVGMGCTLCFYSDREAGTVIAVHTPRKITVQIDKATRTDKNGMCENQYYAYEPDPTGATYVVTLRKNGRWVIAKDHTGVLLGQRDKYYDFGF
jgi:hypothetical protein